MNRPFNLDDVSAIVEKALDQSTAAQTRAGHLLGINRDQVRYRIDKFGITRPRQEAGVPASAT